MTTHLTAPQERHGLPAGLGVLEIAVSAGVSCLAEYLRHERAPAGTGRTAVVLLHDLGGGLDRDLDEHRSLAWFLFAAGFDVLNVDLPGHGMSSGAAADVPAAIRAAAAFVRADGAHGVAYVAAGRSGALLMTLPPDDAAALVLLRPDPGPAPPRPAEGWEFVPALYVVDPEVTSSDDYAQQLAGASRAWNLRCFVHDDERGDPRPAGRGPADSTWAVQSSSLARGFLLEQTFYWRRQHPAGEVSE